jgi:hypothetical protein
MKNPDGMLASLEFQVFSPSFFAPMPSFSVTIQSQNALEKAWQEQKAPKR